MPFPQRTTTRTATQAFIADPNSIDRNQGRQIDWPNVGNNFRQVPGQVVTTTAIAAAAATSVAVSALAQALPSGTVLNFLPGAGKFAKLTANAAAGATSLTVEALPTALASGDTAVVAGSGPKTLKAGTVVGELLGTGKVSPRVVTTNPAIGLLETDAVEDDLQDAASGYGVIVGGVIFENLLPDATGGPPKVLASAVKTELQTAGVGTGFAFQEYQDVR